MKIQVTSSSYAIGSLTINVEGAMGQILYDSEVWIFAGDTLICYRKTDTGILNVKLPYGMYTVEAHYKRIYSVLEDVLLNYNKTITMTVPVIIDLFGRPLTITLLVGIVEIVVITSILLIVMRVLGRSAEGPPPYDM